MGNLIPIQLHYFNPQISQSPTQMKGEKTYAG